MSEPETAPHDSASDSESDGPPDEVRHAAGLANRVLEHHFGSPAKQMTHETSGASNHVFTADHDQGEFVLRLSSEPARLETYRKEQWVIERVRAEGVPTPEVIAVGATVVPWPYMLMHRADGTEATTHARRGEILRALGAQAARINAIATTGFGDVFDWAPADVPRRGTWRDFITDELCVDRQLEILEREGMVPPPKVAHIRETLEALGDMPRQPRLNHGDLRLKNVMAADDGTVVAVLDWEKSISGLAPEWELSLALHDLSVDEKEEFARGYELSPQELERHAPALTALNIVNYAPFIERAAQAGDGEQLARYRLRLNGSLDLYSP